jgi:serine/threonine-protein kinase
MVRTQRRPPVIWVWAGIVSVVVIVIAVMFWVFTLSPSTDIPDNSRKIPSLAGQSYDEAQDALLELDLAATKAEETSDTVPAQQVIRTDPPSGTIVQPAEVIKVVVSTGPVPITVPDVTNRPVADAQAAITELGLEPGTVNRENSANVPADVVIRTDPAAGTTAHAGVTINIFISNGLVELTDLTGQSLTAATELLKAPTLQLVPIPDADYTCDQEPGSPVTSQSIPPGDVPQKSEVTLTYCAG